MLLGEREIYEHGYFLIYNSVFVLLNPFSSLYINNRTNNPRTVDSSIRDEAH